MQLIANRLDYSDNSLSTLYQNQKKIAAFEYVFYLINQKMDLLKNIGIHNPDMLEVGLAYLKGLKNILNITILTMLHEELSHVNEDDIKLANNLLVEYLSYDENIYKSLLETDEIKRRYST